MITNLRRLLVVRMLYWTHFVAAVLVPFLTDWGGLTLLQVFTLNAWFMFWNLVFEVPTGAIADRFGRKWSIAALRATRRVQAENEARSGSYWLSPVRIFTKTSCVTSSASHGFQISVRT